MNFEDRGGARLKKLLANPERAERVTQIRQQMIADDLGHQTADKARPGAPSPVTSTCDDDHGQPNR